MNIKSHKLAMTLMSVAILAPSQSFYKINCGYTRKGNFEGAINQHEKNKKKHKKNKS